MREITTVAERDEALGELEALLFAATRPLTAVEIARRLGLTPEQAQALLEFWQQQLESPARGLQLREAAGRYRLETKPQHNDILAHERAARRERPLTAQALEVLAVIALAQPVTTEEVSRTRGAESYASIETLRRHGLVTAAEAQGLPGKATRWRTTQRLLDRLGLGSLAELAQIGAQQALLGDRTAARKLAVPESPLPEQGRLRLQ